MAPVLIGTSAEKTVTGTGPQTLTFTEADLPAGVLLGDRIVSIIHFWSEYNVYASYPTLPSGWSDDEVVGNGGTGYGTVGIAFRSTRMGAGVFPAATTWSASILSFTLWGTLYVWRDSYSRSFSDDEEVSQFDPTPPVWSPGSYAATGAGFAMAAIAAQPSGTVTGLSTANGFALVSPSGRWNAAKAWDGPQTVTPPEWAMNNYGSGGADRGGGVGPLRHLRPASDPASVGYRGMDDLLVRSQHPGPPALLSPEIAGHCHVDVGDEPLIPGVAELAEPSRVNLEHLGAT